MNCISDFFTYETTKSVVVKSWTIGIINRVVQLLIISYFVGWVFLHEKAYQVRDTAIESSVVTKVKGSGLYANRVMDVSDYVTPPQGTSVFVIITKMIVTENQMQGFCPESEEKYRCVSDSQCGPERFPGGGILTGRCVNYSSVLRTCEIQGWCPTEVDTVETPIMMEAENFTIFIKNSIRFPLFNFEKGNLLPNLTARDMKTCRFHPDKDPFCPILRVGDVVKFAGQDFAKLARTGGVLGIKIGWVCDLDKAWDQCIPKYSFTRLDSVSEKSSVSPGYNFRFAKYYKMENGSEYRTLLKAFGIRFDVLVYGNAGKFNIIPTIISSVAAFTSVGVGTVLCDIILLNFLKGADQYKAKKFEEVNETTLKIAALTNPVYPSDQTTAEKQSTDSGAFSIGH
ncbi:P2RX3 isoform 3 [Pan troglodytes]|uniref:P2X purinoceptor n=4 Tax=Pan TaxID=9596 RepID=A0A6D2WGU3_PANTR|nr:P2X purinoceptor 3 isoform X1 [Pan troglodytes]XP_003826484.1 P2X purinoceptor 3 isoform X1 [Pan paniscus]XP_030665983.1 P2X purinoceptor 3 [Nomascus leucogenys]XP_054950301.1 P2X purinoceptor 3 isoform X1 [Pan paniscus]PNI44850.1 P2RX3 isoform 2 [Pan troglodytes]PNI44851.1 P2RX3 isoform 3 [Pan troglodytes]